MRGSANLLGSVPLDNIEKFQYLLFFERVHWFFFIGSALLYNPIKIICSAYHLIIMKFSKTLRWVHSTGYTKTK